MDPKISNPNNNKDTNNHQLLNVWSMAGEIGLLIAVPVVVLVLLGIKLDKLFSTTPLFIIIGIILAAIISIIGVTRKIKKINLL
ncbi:MAG: AtpZ/AtpI family protein [bacterium]|nr:AtpZ/AtpI family protein [bacterium]